MSEARHTPGPWSVIPQHQAGPMIAQRYGTGKQMHPTGLRLVCHVLQRGNSLGEGEANARLIAAAPDLLHALTCIAEWMEDADAEEYVRGREQTRKIARAALAKARGEVGDE